MLSVIASAPAAWAISAVARRSVSSMRRVGGRLGVDHPRVGPHRAGERLGVGLIDLRHLDAVARQGGGHLREGRGVVGELGHHVVPGPQVGHQRDGHRGHPRADRQRRLGALQIGQHRLHLLGVGRGQPPIEHRRGDAGGHRRALLGRGHLEGAGLVDRRCHRRGHPLLPGAVDQPRLQRVVASLLAHRRCPHPAMSSRGAAPRPASVL